MKPRRSCFANRLCSSRTKKRLKQRHRFTGRNPHRSLSGQKIGDALVTGHVTLAAEDAPVYGERGQAKGLPMVRKTVEKGVRGTIISLGRIAENARDG